jgi:ribosomal-protein-alanine N-acetyltransferase
MGKTAPDCEGHHGERNQKFHQLVNNLNFSPFPQLTTGRFMLREINEADAPLIHELRSDQETSALTGRENSKSIEDALLFIDRIKSGIQRNECIYWVVCFENSPDLIGTIGIWNFDIPTGAAEIGYELLPGVRAQGIMSEVLPGVIQFGFEQMKLNRINAFCSEQNEGSSKLLKKCGFKLSSVPADDPNPPDPGMLCFVLTAFQA